jgi:hypothetical protein
VTPRNAAAVAELCRRLEGIPLAIELAAARAKVLTPSQMLAHLERRFDFLVSRKRDAVERHRSLWSAVEWSVRLLSADLRRFFYQLSVFRGGWSVEAAEAICEVPLALEYLEHLAECSLALAEETEWGMRFRMLETLREFAEASLREEERAVAVQKHLDYFLSLAQTAASAMHGPEQQSWLERLESEHDNLRAALTGCLPLTDPPAGRAPSDAAAGLRLAVALARFWFMRGYLSEGRRWLTALLEGTAAPAELRGKALHAIGGLAREQGEYLTARSSLEASLTLRREIGDSAGIAETLTALGLIMTRQGRPEQAHIYYEENNHVHSRGISTRKEAAIFWNASAAVGERRTDARRRAEPVRLGIQRHGPAGQRHLHGQRHPGTGDRIDRRGGRHSRQRFQPGAQVRWHGLGLGIQPVRRTGQRHLHDRKSLGHRYPGSGTWNDRSGRHRRQRQPQPGVEGRRHRLGLGRQRIRPAGQRHIHT